MGVGPGDEVALQAFTCVAVPDAILAVGAKPIYIDIEPDGFNMDPQSLAKTISPRTRAVIVQHTFGLVARLSELKNTAKAQGAALIEDCCHTLSSTHRSIPVGAEGQAAFYSFEWGKPIVAGIGGMARSVESTFQSRLEADFERYREPPRSRVLRLEAQYTAFNSFYRPSLYWVARSAYRALGKLRIAESNDTALERGLPNPEYGWRISSKVRHRLQAKANDVEAVAEHSTRVVAQYQTLLDRTAARQPVSIPESQPVYCRYPLVVQNKTTLIDRARISNVELASWYLSPVHPLEKEQWGLVGYQAGSCPNAEQRCREVVTLPTHRGMTPRLIEQSADLIKAHAR